MLTQLVRRWTTLRQRQWLRTALRRYPYEIRAWYPDLAAVGLKRRGVVIDVGASVGTFADVVLAYQPFADLHAFEPIPAAFTELKAKMAPFGGVHVINAAMGRRQETRNLAVRGFNECSSFLDIAPALTRGMPALDLSLVGDIAVPVTTLDAYATDQQLTSIQLLKLDVQGYELEVLSGATRTLPNVDWVYAEAQFQELYVGAPLFQDVARFLRAHEFSLFRMGSFKWDQKGELLECDMLFKNNRLSKS